MSWLKLDPPRSSMPEHKFCLAARNHFPKLFWPHRDSFDWDVAAFYRSRADQPINYFLPGTPDLLMRFGEYPYKPCDRPEASAVNLQVGSSIAWDAARVKLPDDTRPYPGGDEELDEVDTGYWADFIGSGGKGRPTDGHDA